MTTGRDLLGPNDGGGDAARKSNAREQYVTDEALMTDKPPDNPNPRLHEIDPDEPLSLDEEPLTPYEMEVKDHWERFCPKLVQQLKAQGPFALEEAIRKATHREEYLISLTLARHPAAP